MKIFVFPSKHHQHHHYYHCLQLNIAIILMNKTKDDWIFPHQEMCAYLCHSLILCISLPTARKHNNSSIFIRFFISLSLFEISLFLLLIYFSLYFSLSFSDHSLTIFILHFFPFPCHAPLCVSVSFISARRKKKQQHPHTHKHTSGIIASENKRSAYFDCLFQFSVYNARSTLEY